ncbi:hypothetical protein LPTSP4_23570 [Leptospira ryugenii]|uniref:Uncharacterized protein n=1 Tax=Leptospira ryugenii TaxID=1917863 RepID=A0A2P2E1T5_9LEPT|nr:hypothetical protein LPTSP4_23570 [Leptospira ryugenii]
MIDRYCSRVYELALYNRALLDQDTILAKEDTMRLNCILSDTTYDDLLELSYIAMVNRTKMFRILLNWDTERPEPRVRLVA